MVSQMKISAFGNYDLRAHVCVIPNNILSFINLSNSGHCNGTCVFDVSYLYIFFRSKMFARDLATRPLQPQDWCLIKMNGPDREAVITAFNAGDFQPSSALAAIFEVAHPWE